MVLILKILFFLFLFNPIYSEPTKKKEQEMRNWIKQELHNSPKRQNESKILKALEYMQVLFYKEKEGQEFLENILQYPDNFSQNFLSEALEVAYNLYPEELLPYIEKIQENTNNERIFAISSLYTHRIFPERKDNILNQIEKQLTNPSKQLVLSALKNYLTEYKDSKKRPPLAELFSLNPHQNSILLFSLHRNDRNFPGILLVKKGNKFLRRSDGSIFFISQFGRSFSDLPYFLFNGNTPQGVYSIQGVSRLQNEWIGPTPAVITNLPIEITVDKFFHTPLKENWSLPLYLTLFPDSWKNYFPIQEAYIAGKIGRNGIFSHGTNLDPLWYKSSSFFPNTPTKGCLSTKEIRTTSQKLIYSEQKMLLTVLEQSPHLHGFLYVINLNDKKEPVTLDDILSDILELE